MTLQDKILICVGIIILLCFINGWVSAIADAMIAKACIEHPNSSVLEGRSVFIKKRYNAFISIDYPEGVSNIDKYTDITTTMPFDDLEYTKSGIQSLSDLNGKISPIDK